MSVLDEEKIQHVRNVLVLARPYKELVALSEWPPKPSSIFAHIRPGFEYQVPLLIVNYFAMYKVYSQICLDMVTDHVLGVEQYSTLLKRSLQKVTRGVIGYCFNRELCLKPS